MRILQYIAYFPPHIGGLETHSEERAIWWIKKNYGTVMIATYNIGQPIDSLTYNKNGYTVVCIPAFEILPTFPFPQFRKKQYREAQRIIKSYNPDIIITRTRFFIPSFIGGILAKIWGKKWVHIEHGVDYVKMNAKRKEIIAWIYDNIIGRNIFLYADQVIAISEGCQRFVNKFATRNVPVIYRGLDSAIKPNPIDYNITVFQFGFVGRLVKLKGVESILYGCKQLIDSGIENFHCSIVGDGEEKNNLIALQKKLKLDNVVTFYGYQNKSFLENIFYPQMHCIINASLQEGLPTSVIEGLLAQCVVVATDVGGTKEISQQRDLILCKPNSIKDLVIAFEKAMNSYCISAGISYKIILNKFVRNTNIDHYAKLFFLLLK